MQDLNTMVNEAQKFYEDQKELFNYHESHKGKRTHGNWSAGC